MLSRVSIYKFALCFLLVPSSLCCATDLSESFLKFNKGKKGRKQKRNVFSESNKEWVRSCVSPLAQDYALNFAHHAARQKFSETEILGVISIISYLTPVSEVQSLAFHFASESIERELACPSEIIQAIESLMAQDILLTSKIVALNAFRHAAEQGVFAGSVAPLVARIAQGKEPECFCHPDNSEELFKALYFVINIHYLGLKAPIEDIMAEHEAHKQERIPFIALLVDRGKSASFRDAQSYLDRAVKSLSDTSLIYHMLGIVYFVYKNRPSEALESIIALSCKISEIKCNKPVMRDILGRIVINEPQKSFADIVSEVMLMMDTIMKYRMHIDAEEEMRLDRYGTGENMIVIKREHDLALVFILLSMNSGWTFSEAQKSLNHLIKDVKVGGSIREVLLNGISTIVEKKA